MKNKPKISSKEYVKRGGAVCPMCESKEVSTGALEWREEGCVVCADCDDCGASWDEDYALVSYGNLEPGETRSVNHG